MEWRLGDVIKNKLKDGPHFMITEITGNTIICLHLEGPNENEYAYFSVEDMWVFKKV